MTASRRRGNAMLLAGVTAIMPVLLQEIAPVPAHASEVRHFSPPLQPMVLTRIVRRPMPDGEFVQSTRSYSVRFISEANGYRVEGELVAADVQAPPGMDDFVALERKRPDTGLFPIRLDALGQLLPNAPTAPSKETRQAVALAMAKLEKAGLSLEETRKAKDFVRQIESSSGKSPWPEDLFHPEPGLRQQFQTIPLPNGAQGQVAIEIDARTHGATGLVSSFSRKVTTRLGGDTRVTEEVWTLSPRP